MLSCVLWCLAASQKFIARVKPRIFKKTNTLGMAFIGMWFLDRTSNLTPCCLIKTVSSV